jgi:hypothetical protein
LKRLEDIAKVEKVQDKISCDFEKKTIKRDEKVAGERRSCTRRCESWSESLWNSSSVSLAGVFIFETLMYLLLEIISITAVAYMLSTRGFVFDGSELGSYYL